MQFSDLLQETDLFFVCLFVCLFVLFFFPLTLYISFQYFYWQIAIHQHFTTTGACPEEELWEPWPLGSLKGYKKEDIGKRKKGR